MKKQAQPAPTEPTFLFYFLIQHYHEKYKEQNPESEGWRGNATHPKRMTETEAQVEAKRRLAEERKILSDHAWLGVNDNGPVRRRVKIRKVVEYVDTFIY